MKFYHLCLPLFFLTACGSSPQPQAPSSEAAKPKLQELRIGTRRAPDSLNPYVTVTPAGEAMVARLFPSLFRELPEFDNGVPKLEPVLVDSFQFSEDGLTLDLAMKSGLVWSDGHPLLAADVAYTVSVQQNPEVAWLNSDRKARISKVEVVDDLHLKVTFLSASPFNLLDLNDGLILPKHYFEPIPIADWKRNWGAEMVVYGPYKVGFIEEDKRLTLEGVKPGIPRLGFVFVRERETLFQLVKAGELDYAWSLPNERLEDLNDGMQAHIYNDMGIAFIAFNPIDPQALEGKDLTDPKVLAGLKEKSPHRLFGDVRVRKALLLASNRQDYLQRFWKGTSMVPADPWQVGLNAYPTSEVAEPYDLEKAAALLDEAGWVLEGQQRIKNGVPLSFKVITSSGRGLFENYLLALQQDYQRLGVTLEIELQEGQVFAEHSMTRNFDVMCGEFKTGSRPDRSDAFHSSSQFNFSSWLIDDELAAVRDASTVAQMQEGVSHLEALFHRDVPMIMLYARFELAASAPGLKGGGNYLDPLYQVETWTKTE